MRNRILAAGLALTLLCGTCVPAALAAPVESQPFTDIADPNVAQSAELLRLLGIVNGTGGSAYQPDGLLTRAQFCKLAVEIMDKGDLVAGQMNRTIFRDVPSTHWARGYVNVASQAQGETPPIIRGDDTGSFRPDDAVTYAQAVTILMRILGYSDDMVGFGAAWYDGYLSTAASIGMTDKLTLSPESSLTRGQAALLLDGFLHTPSRGAKEDYLITVLGCSYTEETLLLDVDATAPDGSAGVKTSAGIYKTDRSFDSSLEGQEGKLLLDADKKLLAFTPRENVTRRAVNILTAEATYITVSGGEKIDIEPDTNVYRNGNETTWQSVSADVRASTSAVLNYGADGKLNYVFFPSVDSGADVMVARSAGSGNPFASMAGGKSFTMYKNGILASASDVRQYDVATYDSASGVIQVSDLKLTGIYENVSPSPAAPLTVKVMGKTFDVLSTARADLASFKLGDRITLLLTNDQKVAGAVSADVVKGDAVGVATVSNGSASVKLLQSGLEVSGEFSGSADRYNNQLVTVTSSAVNKLSLSLVSGASSSGSLNTAERTLGSRAVAENVVVYDRVHDGDMVEVDYDALPAAVSASKISFVAYDYAGRVKYLVLNDATGDAYTYGYLGYKQETRKITKLDGTGTDTYQVNLLWVTRADANGSEAKSEEYISLQTVKQNVPGGLALTADGQIAATVTLKELAHVKRAAFDVEDMTVTVSGVAYPISKDVQCYNKTAKSWFKPGKTGLEAVRAYSDDLTLYYDRAPGEGGKIRLIVAE